MFRSCLAAMAAATASAGSAVVPTISGLWISKDTSAISLGEAKDVQLERTNTSELTIHNNVVLDGDITGAGDAAFAGDLVVAGESTFDDTVTIKGHLEVSNTISTGCVHLYRAGSLAGAALVARGFPRSRFPSLPHSADPLLNRHNHSTHPPITHHPPTPPQGRQDHPRLPPVLHDH
jgi:hypothetical protein